MDKKRKISVRKILQMLVTLVVSVGCIVAISSASNKEIGRSVTGVEIHIKNNRHKFVDEHEIKNIILRANGTNVVGYPMNKLNVRAIEDSILGNKWVATAQVYIDNTRELHVNVSQRVPVARIFEESGESYYIDGTMSIMPTSDRYVYYTTVVTGVPHLQSDSTGRSLMGQIAHVVKRIERDSFWNAQVSQIIMGADRTFEIVPVLGDQRILLGDTANLDTKLGNLFAFYKKVMNRVGWDRYDVIDLRYKGQIVASPALQWKMPAGITLTDPKWVQTIKSKAAYNQNTFSLDSNNVGVVVPRNASVSGGGSGSVSASSGNNGAGRTEPAAAKKEMPKTIIGPPEDKEPKKPVSKTEPKKKETARPVVKIGPMPDNAKTKNEKKASVAKSKPNEKPAAKAVVKKETKKDDKKNDKKKEEKKKAGKKAKENKPASKEDKAKSGKYIYNNNH